jgi:hypothetical protein
LSPGELLACGSGVLLLVALFLPWYRAGGAEASAWDAFAVTDALLLVVALLAIAGSLATVADRTYPMSITVLALAAFIGIFGSLAALFRVLDPPGPGEVERAVGAWLGLAAVVGCTVGAWRGMKDEGPARRGDAAGRVAAAAARERAEHLELPRDLADNRRIGEGAAQ